MSRDNHNLNQQKSVRRALRRQATVAERALWKLIRNRQLDGRKFRRQYGIGPYVVDFFCTEESLAIELDGGHHRNPRQREHDRKRTDFLSDQGVSVLRFENRLVLEHPAFVLEAIRRRFETSSP